MQNRFQIRGSRNVLRAAEHQEPGDNQNSIITEPVCLADRLCPINELLFRIPVMECSTYYEGSLLQLIESLQKISLDILNVFNSNGYPQYTRCDT